MQDTPPSGPSTLIFRMTSLIWCLTALRIAPKARIVVQIRSSRAKTRENFNSNIKVWKTVLILRSSTIITPPWFRVRLFRSATVSRKAVTHRWFRASIMTSSRSPRADRSRRHARDRIQESSLQCKRRMWVMAWGVRIATRLAILSVVLYLAVLEATFPPRNTTVEMILESRKSQLSPSR